MEVHDRSTGPAESSSLPEEPALLTMLWSTSVMLFCAATPFTLALFTWVVATSILLLRAGRTRRSPGW